MPIGFFYVMLLIWNMTCASNGGGHNLNIQSGQKPPILDSYDGKIELFDHVN